MAFIMLRYIPSIPGLLRVVMIKRCWIVSKFFLHLLRWAYIYLSFFLLMWLIIWLAYVELGLIPRDISHLTMVYDYLKCCPFHFVSIFWGIFHLGSWRILVYNFLFFFLRVLACLLYHKWVWKHFLLFTFLEDFEKDSC